MGIINALFGRQSSYSGSMHALSREQIEMLVSQSRVRTLDQAEEQLVETALDHARSGGKISLQKIERVLQSLVNTDSISVYDKQTLMQLFHAFLPK